MAWLLTALIAVGCVPRARVPDRDGAEYGLGGRQRVLVSGVADEIDPLPDPLHSRLIFVSNASGNRDLWSRPLAGGVAERLTEHSADDFDPALSPDGQTLIFASHRFDAKGDLFRMPALGGPVVRLTDRASADRQPVFLPGGRELIFTGAEGGGGEALYRLDLERGTRHRLSSRAGFDPAVSADGRWVLFTSMVSEEGGGGRPCLFLHRLSDGWERQLHDCPTPEAFGAWAEWEGQSWIVFSRFHDDTNGDGLQDVKDRPGLWRVAIRALDGPAPETGPPVPITPATSADISPFPLGGALLYASRSDEDLDIWTVPLSGAGPKVSDGAGALELADEAAELQTALFILRRCAGEWDGSPEAARCALAEADRLLAAGRLAQAAAAYDRLAGDLRESGLREPARLGSIAARMEHQLPPDLTRSQQVERQAEAESLLAELEQLGPVRGRRALVQADLLRRVGRWGVALTVLDSLAADTAVSRSTLARAALLRAEILRRLGAAEAALESLLSVLRDYPRRHREQLEAAKAVLSLAGLDPALGLASADQVERLERIDRRWPDLPVLPALVRVEIGRLHRKAGRFALARRSFEEVERRQDSAPEMVARALLNLSWMAEQQGDLAQALDHAEEMRQRFPDQPRMRRLVRKRIRRVAAALAAQLEHQGESGMAIKAYRQLVAQDANDLHAQRRLIDLLAQTGRAAEAVAETSRRARENPRDDRAGYLAALALTYLDPPAHFDTALEGLERVLTLNPQLAFAHQTRGWIYEQLHRRTGDRDDLLRAADAYQLALGLLDERAGSRVEADLLQNLGNVQLALGNSRQALLALRRREDCGVEFDQPLRRLAFWEQLGRAAFLADEAADAERAYAQAEVLRRSPLGRTERLARTVAALAAAQQVQGKHAAAADTFGRACRLYSEAGQVERLAICRRNEGFNRFMSGELRPAVAAFEEAWSLLQPGGDRKVEAGRTVSVAGSGGSGAAFGFDERGERNFLTTFEARLWRQAGEPARARAALQRKLALLAAAGDDAPAPLLLDRAVATNHLAHLRLEAGDPAAADGLFAEAQRLAARVGSGEGAIVNGLCRLDLVLGSGKAGAGLESVRRSLVAIEAELAAGNLSARPESRVRLANALALLEWAEARNGPNPPAATAAAGIAGSLGALDRELRGLRRTRSALAAAYSAAGAIPSRQGVRLAGLIGQNLIEVQAMLGEGEAVAARTAEVRRMVDDLELLEIGWRLEASGPPAERLARLQALPPPVAGTDADAEAGRERDRLFADRLAEAVAAGRSAEAFGWLESALARRRLDRTFQFEAGVGESADRTFLAGVRQRAAALQQALDRLTPELDEGERQMVREAIRTAHQDFEAFRIRGGEPHPWLRAWANAQAPVAAEVQAALEPGEGLLSLAALPDRLVMFLVTSGEIRLIERPLSAARLARLAQDMLGSDLTAAAAARLHLSEALLSPLAEDLGRLETLVAVTDEPGLSLGMLLLGGETLGPRVAVSQVYCAGDWLRLRALRDLPVPRATWAGSAPSPGWDQALRADFGALQLAPSGDAGAAWTPGDTGLMVWAGELHPDPRQPLRTSLWPDRRLGALGGWSLGRLALQPAPASLWVLLEPGQDTPPPAGALDLAMTGAGVPSAWWLGAPAERARPALAELAGESPARALWRTAGAALSEGVSWRELVRWQVRGDPGMGKLARRAFAERRLQTAVAGAMAAFRDGRWSAARTGFLQVRQLALFLEQRPLLLRVDQLIVQAAFQLAEYDLAAQAQGRLLEAARVAGDGRALAAAQNLLGVIDTRAGRCQAASQGLRSAAAAFAALDLQAEAAGAEANLALACDSCARYAEALAAAESALERYRRLGQPEQELRMLRTIGATELRRLNLATTARATYSQALERAQRLGEPLKVAAVQLDLARCDQVTGNYEGALALAQQAEAIAQAAGDRVMRAEATLERASALWYLADYQPAFKAQRQALALAEEAGERRLSIMARSLGGLIALNLGDLETAERFLTQALAESRRVPRLRDEEATALNNLGIVARERGDLAPAMERFGDALRLDEEQKNALGRAYDLRNLGIAERMLGRLELAAAHLEESLGLSRAAGDRFNEAKGLLGLARLELDRDRLEVAEARAAEALALADKIQLRDVAWRALRSLGEIERRRGRLEVAVGRWSAAIEIVERMRSGLKMEEFRSGFLDDKYDLYQDLILGLLELDRAAESFRIAERARARGFLDLLANRRLRLGTTGGQAMLDRIQHSREELNRLTERSRSAPEPQRVAAEQALEQGQRSHEALLADLEQARPELADFVEVRSLSAEEIRRVLPAGVALVSYYLTRTEVLAWVLRPEGLWARRLPLPRGELVPRVERVRELLENFAPVERELLELYQALVAPLTEQLFGISTIGVLPHDVLNYLPFAALQPAPGEYWGDRVALFQAPSASVLHLLLQRGSAQPLGTDGALVLGNPALDPAAADLPFAEREARAVAFERDGAPVNLGSGASEALFKARASEGEVLHLACHGVFDPDSPLKSGLRLAPGGGEDGDLTALEVFGLSLRARLVTLSACQTALGKRTRGDEIVGLQRAFLAAGTGAVVASLWRVSDVATAMLMKRFYRYLRQAPPAEALQQARRLVRRYFSHPGYWAGFVLTGDWR